MTEFYFDTETTGEEGRRPDPSKDELVTIQYQELEPWTGKPKGDLIILKRWEYESEKELFVDFWGKFYSEDRPFDFVPVGANIYGYDYFLLARMAREHLGIDCMDHLFRGKPTIDLKHVCVMINDNGFKGWSALLGKAGGGGNVPGWYASRNYEAILGYVREEAKTVIEWYQVLRRELPKLRPLLAPSQK